jgi:hypothetical protein
MVINLIADKVSFIGCNSASLRFLWLHSFLSNFTVPNMYLFEFAIEFIDRHIFVSYPHLSPSLNLIKLQQQRFPALEMRAWFEDKLIAPLSRCGILDEAMREPKIK